MPAINKLLVIAILLFGQAAFAQQIPRREIQAYLDEWRGSAKFPGVTLAVCSANTECVAFASGLSGRDARTPMKPGDVMLAGSVGKTFVAAIALQLVSEGKIGLDDKIEKYFGREPWFSRLPNGKDTTVRMLMNHTSGLVRYEFKEQFAKDLTADPYKVWTPIERLNYVFDSKPPFEAGKGWEYSDTNYIVLGMVIEKVTGKQYYDLARKRLLRKFKLRSTIPQEGPVIKGLIPGYAGDNNPFGGKDAMMSGGRLIVNPQLEWTGGGMASNVEDLARWAKVMYEGKAVPPQLLPEMLDGAPAPMLGRDAKYGLGVIIRNTRLGISYGHSGFFPGYLTDLMYFPEHKIAIAVQVNTSVPQQLGRPLGRVLVDTLETVSKSQKSASK